ncbi:MAG: AarF/ABC1/UbiB kinase family protein [Planctomycetota bacterium]|nr:AarF/ABC1/UbiB kinase family protein [Planctomycetota bacterium]
MRFSTIPQFYRHFNRWIEILRILSKYGLAGWMSRMPLRFARSLLTDGSGTALARYSRETRIRMALAELGPTFVKLGQILSTRPDLVGVPLADELSLLQDDVPADPAAVVFRTVEAELCRPLSSMFSQFDPVPLASASIGQVHRARLRTGELVVVKVQHARIEERIHVDLDILAGLAQLAEKIPEFSNYRPQGIVAEFHRTLRRELDFCRELRNLNQFSRNFQHDTTVRIPKSYPEFSTSRVLTMEYLQGTPLTEIARHGQDGQEGVDLDEIARRGANVYLTMIFEHGFYHADPHPGNVLVMRGDTVGLVDFGMVGRLDDSLREEIEQLLIALSESDPNELTAIIMRLGQVPPKLDQAALSLEVADFVSHYVSQPLESLNLGLALKEMAGMIQRYHIMLPSRVAMLLKSLMMLEGISRIASPKFSLIEAMIPHRRGIIWRRMSPKRRWRKLKRTATDFERLVEVFPRRVHEFLDQAREGKFDVHLDHRGLEPSVNRLVLGMLTSALFLGSTLLFSRETAPLLGGISILGASGYLVSLFLGLRLLRAINKSGHLDRRI